MLYQEIINSHERSIADLIITALSGGLLALSKGGVYLPILGILFMMPQLRSNRKLRRGAEIGGGMAAIAVAARFIPMLLDLSKSSRGEQSELRYYSLADFFGGQTVRKLADCAPDELVVTDSTMNPFHIYICTLKTE